MHTMHLLSSVAIQPNLELKTWPKQHLGSLPLVIALPGVIKHSIFNMMSIFVQLGFNLSNRVPDTLESSSILICFETRKSIYTQQNG